MTLNGVMTTSGQWSAVAELLVSIIPQSTDIIWIVMEFMNIY